MPGSEVNANDIGATEIAAAFGVSMSVSTAVFLLLQVVKGFYPNLSGKAAEAAVVVTSAIAVSLALMGVHADWGKTDTWLAMVVGSLSLTVTARGLYAQLFKVSVQGSPPSSEAMATKVDDPQVEKPKPVRKPRIPKLKAES